VGDPFQDSGASRTISNDQFQSRDGSGEQGVALSSSSLPGRNSNSVFSSIGALTAHLNSLLTKKVSEKDVIKEIRANINEASSREHAIIVASPRFRYLMQLLIFGMLKGDKLFIKAGFLLMNDSSLLRDGRKRDSTSILLDTLALLDLELNKCLRGESVDGFEIESFKTSYALIFVYLGLKVAACKIEEMRKRVQTAMANNEESVATLQEQLKAMEEAFKQSMKRHFDYDGINSTQWKLFFNTMLTMEDDFSIPDLGNFDLSEEEMTEINQSLQEALLSDATEIEERTVAGFSTSYVDGLDVIKSHNHLVPNLQNIAPVTEAENEQTCSAFKVSYELGVEALVYFERFIDSTTLSPEGVISAQVSTSAKHTAEHILQPTSATSRSGAPSSSLPSSSSSSGPFLISSSRSGAPSSSLPSSSSSSGPFLISSSRSGAPSSSLPSSSSSSGPFLISSSRSGGPSSSLPSSSSSSGPFLISSSRSGAPSSSLPSSSSSSGPFLISSSRSGAPSSSLPSSSSTTSSSSSSSNVLELTAVDREEVVIHEAEDTAEELPNYKDDEGNEDLNNDYGAGDIEGVIAQDDQSELSTWLGAVHLMNIVSNPGTITLVSPKLLGVAPLGMKLYGHSVRLRIMHNPVHPADNKLRVPLQAKGSLNLI
jgi:hypothetical protein